METQPRLVFLLNKVSKSLKEQVWKTRKSHSFVDGYENVVEGDIVQSCESKMAI